MRRRRFHLWIRHAADSRYAYDRRAPPRAAGIPGWCRFIGVPFFENIFQHVDHFARISAFKLDEFAHHFRRRNIDLVDDLPERPNDSSNFP